MQDRQQVIDEKKELDARLAKLSAFLSDPSRNADVVGKAYVLMNAQERIMAEYSRILGERIALFISDK